MSQQLGGLVLAVSEGCFCCSLTGSEAALGNLPHSSHWLGVLVGLVQGRQEPCLAQESSCLGFLVCCVVAGGCLESPTQGAVPVHFQGLR